MDELAILQTEIDRAKDRVREHEARIVDLRSRRLGTTEEEAMLHIALSALATMKERRTNLQAYIALVERLKS